MAVIRADQSSGERRKRSGIRQLKDSDTVFHFRNAAARVKAIKTIDKDDPRLRNSEGVTQLVNTGVIPRDLVQEVEIYKTVYEDNSRYPYQMMRAINKKHGVGRPPVRQDVKVFSSRAA